MSEEKNKNDYDEIEDEFDDSEEFSFWSFRTIFTLFLIILLIGAGIYSFNRDSEESIDDKVADLEKTMEDENVSEDVSPEEDNPEEAVTEENNDENSESEEASQDNSEEKPEVTDNSEEVQAQTDEPEKAEEVKSTGEKVSVVVQSGEGVTNLARKAISDYIGNNNIELSVEQKLFAETYMKDLYKSKYTGLNTGDTVEFSSADISNTVSKAKDLSESQINAWSKYVPLVPSLK